MTFPLAPFLAIMGVAIAGPKRRRSVPPGPHAFAHLSAATDLRISQVVDVVEGAHAMIRTSDLGGHR